MIKFIVVYVLTVVGVEYERSYSYQLQYQTKEECSRVANQLKTDYNRTRCDYQKVPVYAGDKK